MRVQEVKLLAANEMTDDQFIVCLIKVTELVLKCEKDLRIEYHPVTHDSPFRVNLWSPQFRQSIDIIIDDGNADIWRIESRDDSDYSLVASIPLGSEKFWSRLLASSVLEELLADCQPSTLDDVDEDQSLKKKSFDWLFNDLLTAFDNDETEVEHDA